MDDLGSQQCSCKSGKLFSECHGPGGTKFIQRKNSKASASKGDAQDISSKQGNLSKSTLQEYMALQHKATSGDNDGGPASKHSMSVPLKAVASKEYLFKVAVDEETMERKRVYANYIQWKKTCIDKDDRKIQRWPELLEKFNGLSYLEMAARCNMGDAGKGWAQTLIHAQNILKCPVSLDNILPADMGTTSNGEFVGRITTQKWFDSVEEKAQELAGMSQAAREHLVYRSQTTKVVLANNKIIPCNLGRQLQATLDDNAAKFMDVVYKIQLDKLIVDSKKDAEENTSTQVDKGKRTLDAYRAARHQETSACHEGGAGINISTNGPYSHAPYQEVLDEETKKRRKSYSTYVNLNMQVKSVWVHSARVRMWPASCPGFVDSIEGMSYLEMAKKYRMYDAAEGWARTLMDLQDNLTCRINFEKILPEDMGMTCDGEFVNVASIKAWFDMIDAKVLAEPLDDFGRKKLAVYKSPATNATLESREIIECHLGLDLHKTLEDNVHKYKETVYKKQVQDRSWECYVCTDGHINHGSSRACVACGAKRNKLRSCQLVRFTCPKCMRYEHHPRPDGYLPDQPHEFKFNIPDSMQCSFCEDGPLETTNKRLKDDHSSPRSFNYSVSKGYAGFGYLRPGL